MTEEKLYEVYDKKHHACAAFYDVPIQTGTLDTKGTPSFMSDLFNDVRNESRQRQKEMNRIAKMCLDAGINPVVLKFEKATDGIWSAECCRIIFQTEEHAALWRLSR